VKEVNNPSFHIHAKKSAVSGKRSDIHKFNANYYYHQKNLNKGENNAH